LFIGLLLVLLACLGWYIHPLWRWADLDPKPTFILTMIGQFVALFCWLALPLWLLFFCGFSRRIKAAIVGVVLLCVGGVFASIDSVAVNGDLQPIPHFRWQPRAQDQLDKHLEEEVQEDVKLPPIDLTIDPVSDFPRYRGAQGDGRVIVPELLQLNWEEAQPELLWRQPCGGGFAGFAVAGNVAITVEQRRDKETVVCYDRATGKERWTYGYVESFKHPTGNGPRATPAITKDGLVYSLGAKGELVCLDGKTGRDKWKKNILDDNEAKRVEWGMTSSPLVMDDLVIVNAGVDPDSNAGRSLVAYHRITGKRVWAEGTFRAGYSSPQKARLANRDQVLIFHAEGLASFDAKTGKELWQYEWKTGMDMNIIQPLVLSEDRVFLSSETSNGCALLKISREGTGFAAQEVWANRKLCSKFSNPVALGGAIYGMSDGTLVCLDQKSGKRYWRGPYYGHGQILAVGGALLVLSERGYVATVAADPKRFRELSRMEVFKNRTWNTPAIAGRQLFLRNDVEMACFELPVRP
jgi:outer membrane protein assembly factor BamB